MEKIKRGEITYQNKKLIVYSTTSYAIFKRSKGNRAGEIWDDPEGNTHVQALAKSMKEQMLFSLLVVNEKMEVIDGQHRLAACRLINAEVYFIVVANYNGEEMQMYNVNSRTWTAYDYCRLYAERGDHHYKKSLAHIEMGVSPTVLVRLVTNSQEMKGFKNGEFKPDWKVIDPEISMLQDFIFLQKRFKVLTNQEMAAAFQLVFRLHGYDHQYFITKLETNHSLMEPHKTYAVIGYRKHMIAKQLISLYNKGKRGAPLEAPKEFFEELGREM